MSKRDVIIYEACDKAIRQMDRDVVEAFGKLKLAKWDKIHIIRTVVNVYKESAKRAQKKYYGVAFEAYLLGLYMCDIKGVEAHRMAEKAITNEWVDEALSQTDFVTLYRFDSETERKAYRLAEALEVSTEQEREIDKAMKAWSQQLAQYAINFTDYAVIQAFEDAGIKEVEWETERDERTCGACGSLDGQTFRLDELPPKPHLKCRCHVKPVLDGESRLK